LKTVAEFVRFWGGIGKSPHSPDKTAKSKVEGTTGLGGGQETVAG